MSFTILVAGATGNTGRSVVETLSKLRDTSTTGTISGYRILALTRSSESPAAKQLATLPHVQVLEKNWVDITAEWLREHEVVRTFIASHNLPTQFVEESGFQVAALKAGVEYVVRISTATTNVRPDCEAYYPRAHWAIEAMLSSPEFKNLQWTSLQPNGFSTMILYNAAEYIKKYRKTAKQETLSLIVSAEAPVAIIDPYDIGVLAAHLLLQKDTSVHNHGRYVVNGPEDITGEQIVKLVEGRIGAKVDSVLYKDMSFVDHIPEYRGQTAVLFSLKKGVETLWDGVCTASTTSKEVLELAKPTRTPTDVLEALLQD
ncbi:hypothetical protein TruAng_001922 [Truncatella angustata]|nr:hypothetical protein TruAng_001922 [Truncatella angustata]